MGAWGATTPYFPVWSDGLASSPTHNGRIPKGVVKLENMCPAFKTQKLLGEYALVSDRAEKPTKGSSMGQEFGARLCPGDGYYGHRDGYNVLYGDWHAAWYGDPQQQLIWFKNYNNNRGNTAYYYNETDSNGVGAGVNWMNFFDAAAGVAPKVDMYYENWW
jgi:hypothetical protein